MAATVTPASVPRLWPGSTIVCIANGPSLTPKDVALCRGRARVVVVKNGIDLCPWADVLYGAGSDSGSQPGWWAHNGPKLAAFAGLRFSLDPKAASWSTVLAMSHARGIESDPAKLAIGHWSGNNSGAQAINLAVHLGAAKIVLLGYDAQPDAQGRDHWFGAHPWKANPNQYGAWPDVFASIQAATAALGVRIMNASRVSAIGCFERCSLTEALA